MFTASTYAIVLLANSVLGWGVPMGTWVPSYVAFFGIWIGVMDVIEGQVGGIWADYTFYANIGLTGFIISTSALDKPVNPM